MSEGLIGRAGMGNHKVLKQRGIGAQLDNEKKQKRIKELEKLIETAEKRIDIRTKNRDSSSYRDFEQKNLDQLRKNIDQADPVDKGRLEDELARKEAEVQRDIAANYEEFNQEIAGYEAELRRYRKELDSLLNPIYVTADAQSLLLFNLDKFKSGGPKTNRYYSQILGNSRQSRSHILSPKNMKELMNIPNHLLSSLVPRVDFFKVQGLTETRIFFEDHQDPRAMTQGSSGRGTGAGIKRVTIDKNGTNTANSDMQVEIKLSLYFSSLEEVFKDRGGYKYADFITPMPIRNPDNSEKYQRMKLTVGYAIPNGTNSELWKAESSLIDSLREIRRSYYLLYTSHNLDFKENGSITLDIEYHGYIEKQLQVTDIFELTMTKEEIRRIRKAQNRLNELQKPAPSNNPDNNNQEISQDDKERIIKTLKQQNSEIRSNAYSSFLRKLFENRQIIRIGFADGDITGLRLNKGLAPEFVEASINTRMKEAAELKKRREKDPKAQPTAKKKESGSFEIEYFYLGNLLESIFELTSRDDTLKDFGFLFTEVPYTDFDTGKVKFVQISQIPIAMNSFTSWFHDNIIKKSERTTYNVRDFIMDIMRNLVSAVFRTQEFREESKAHGKGVIYPTFDYATFNSKSPNIYAGQSIQKDKYEVHSQANSKYSNYLIYSTNSRLEKGVNSRNEDDDAKSGVYHLVAAKERGLTKRIKFTREQQKYAREHMMTSNGITEPGAAFRDLYNANIEMFGNPVFSPGMQVYVTTLAYDRQYAEKLNIVGYYRVIRVSSVIEGGKFQTDLECRWEYL